MEVALSAYDFAKSSDKVVVTSLVACAKKLYDLLIPPYDLATNITESKHMVEVLAQIVDLLKFAELSEDFMRIKVASRIWCKASDMIQAKSSLESCGATLEEMAAHEDIVYYFSALETSSTMYNNYMDDEDLSIRMQHGQNTTPPKPKQHRK